MSSELLITSADLCQSATLAISLAAYLPQWRVLLVSKSSQNISLKSWVLWLVASLLSLFYASVQLYVYGTGGVLVLTSLLGLFFISFTLVLIVRFGSQDEGLRAGRLSSALQAEIEISVQPKKRYLARQSRKGSKKQLRAA